MSERRRHRFRFDPLQHPSDAFMDYLEGYASSMDMYSICPRYTLERHDIGSVVEDFWQVAVDLAASIEEADAVDQKIPAAKDVSHGQAAIGQKQ